MPSLMNVLRLFKFSAERRTNASKKHNVSIIDFKGVFNLLSFIHLYEGNIFTQQALKLAPLLFVRLIKLRHAEWTEIDLAASEWRIPAHKMKMKAFNIVRLSK